MNNLKLYDVVTIIEDYIYECIPDGKILIKKGSQGTIVDETDNPKYVMLELDSDNFGNCNIINIPLNLLKRAD